MVAIRRSLSPTATNVVRRNRNDLAESRPLVEGRSEDRVRCAVRSWVCDDAGSARGYALDLTKDGARFGGVGTRFQVGARVLVKLVLDEAEAPAVLPAEVVRYQPALSCPDLCVRFLDGEDSFRVARFVARLG